MSLFSNAETEAFALTVQKPSNFTASRPFEGKTGHAQLNSLAAIKERLSGLKLGENKVYFSDGSWSNYELMEFLLQITGPALVGFTTWSISEVAITKMNEWVNSGQIIELLAVLDVGLRNRKPHIHQQAIATLKRLKLAHCHAKVMAIVAPEISFLVIGSANFTKNPRKEAGVIICDRDEAEFAFNWVKGIIDGGDL